MITLYQFQSCPFCSKVRSLLNHIDQPFEIVEVTPFGMKELDFTDHKKVPVLKDDDKVITESATIIDYVNEHYAKFPMDENSKEWTDWIDNTLVHYITPLVHSSFGTSRKNLQHILKIGNSGWLKTQLLSFGGAITMPKVAKKLQAKYNIEDPQTEYLAAIDHWSKNGLDGKVFFGGDKPNFVDCSVFGVLNSCHDLGPVKMAMQQNIAFADWYNRCMTTMTKMPSK